jgi:hypothetical protein
MIPRSNLRSIHHDTENLRVRGRRVAAGCRDAGSGSRVSLRDAIVRLMGGKKITVGRGGRVNYSALIAGGLVQIPIPPATMDRRARSLRVRRGYPPRPRMKCGQVCAAECTGRQPRALHSMPEAASSLRPPGPTREEPESQQWTPARAADEMRLGLRRPAPSSPVVICADFTICAGHQLRALHRYTRELGRLLRVDVSPEIR